MRRVLAVEQIYDAAFDDEALRALAGELASCLGARSALIHWIHYDGATDVLAHSGYFSDEQLTLYARDFAHCDPWVQVTSGREFANRVHNLEDLVPIALFTASDFYNDYVRAMGDDTARCMGVRLDSDRGCGFVALQRGLSQRPFDATAVARLQHYSGHLMRMLAMRGRLVTAERNSSELEALVNTLGQPAMLVDSGLRLKQCNRAAERLLRSEEFVRQRGGTLEAADRGSDAALSMAVASALSGGGHSTAALRLPGAAGGSVDLSITSVAAAAGVRLALLLMSDSAANDGTRVARLRELYGLTVREAQVAVMLAEGYSPVDIAEEGRVSIGTVRVQIKQIAFKLGCNRQTEIVRIVSSLPRLHDGGS